MLNEIHCNINYLNFFERVIALSVFDFLCVCLESQRMHSTPTNNLHVSICSSNISKRLINYVINTSNDINDFNSVDLFHHPKATIM